ncbi:DNA-binding transcriptional regulator, GntR family [Rhizobiales bacterium GAS113]|jgi:DNA-binding GntR family transcriptional regulator|nr:DNA-binding transcriptional regulator, GntR family [Rhizobiales bacterium GAS113]
MPLDHRPANDERPLSEVAYDSLKSMILSGRVKPGERLWERELARRVNVSRTPLREALGRLARDGLAVSRPGVGYFAVEFDAKVTEEVYEFRLSLEVTAARAAARRIGQKGIAELNGLLRQLAPIARRKKPTVDELREEMNLGFRIHEVVARECGNRLICEALLQLYDQMRLLSWIDFLWFDKWSLTRQEHKDLVSAVAAHDEKRAAKAAECHVKRCMKDALWVIKVQQGEASNGLTQDIRPSNQIRPGNQARPRKDLRPQ